MKRIRDLLSVLLALAMLTGVLSGTVLAAGPDFQYGTADYYSAIAKDYVGDSYYYTDQWLLGDAAARNDSLALISAQLAAAVTDDPSCGFRLLTGLGFKAKAKRFESAAQDDCAYVIGTKSVSRGGASYTLVAVAFQGTNYGDKGWQQNVTVNGASAPAADHAAFSAAAKAFLADYDKLDLRGNVILWITGQSRAGAVANLAAARLLDRDTHPVIFGYTFESPAVTENKNAHDGKYHCIQNYLCDDDPVTMLPLWGMTRYGQEIRYNTADVAAVAEELAKRNPEAYEYAQGYNAGAFGGDVKAYLEELVSKLAVSVPARADYTAQQTDRFTAGGTNTEVSYTFQGGLQALCHIVFGGGTGGLAAALTPLLDEVSGLTYAYLEEAYVGAKAPENGDALLQDAAQKRWGAAGTLYTAVAGEQGNTPFDQADLYALVKLLSPLVIDTGKVTEPDGTLPDYSVFTEESLAGEYFDMGGVMGLAGNAATLLFSHQPDVILARLRLLAPAPEMEDVALTIQAPKAGDQGTAAPDQIRAAAADPKKDWLTVQEARWLTEDNKLADNKTYYLSVTLSAVGHTLPDGFRFTINGQEPMDRTVGYQDGAVLVTGIWAYALGTPSKVSVTFDANGHGTAPAPVPMDAGTLLRYALEPEDLGIVKDEQGAWRFGGWFDGNGTAWDGVTADQDVTLLARWSPVIDDIALTYAVPRVGDSGESLLTVSVPEGAPYRADEICLYDMEWSTVTAVNGTDELMLSIKIFPADDDVSFLTEKTEDGEIYVGTLTVNGEEITDYYYEDFIEWVDEETQVRHRFLSLDYTFTPLSGGSHSDSGDGFVDVPAGAYYAGAVEWAVEKGVTTGVDATHFAPDASCTRAQMVTFLWRAAGQPEPAAAENPFVDVPAGAYYRDAVLWAAEQGITTGTDETHFSPDNTVSRGEAVTFLYRFAGEETGGTAPFADVPEDAYYAGAVRWAAANGVTAGKTATAFAPADDCTRGQIVTFLYRAMGQA